MKIQLNIKCIWLGNGISDYISYLCIAVIVMLTLSRGVKMFLIPLYFLALLFILTKIYLVLKCIRKIPAIICDDEYVYLNFGFRFGLNKFAVTRINYVDINKKEIVLLSSGQRFSLSSIDRTDLQLLNNEIVRICRIKEMSAK